MSAPEIGRRGFVAALAAALSSLGLRRAAASPGVTEHPAPTRLPDPFQGRLDVEITMTPFREAAPELLSVDALADLMGRIYADWWTMLPQFRTPQALAERVCPFLAEQWRLAVGDRYCRDHELFARRGDRTVATIDVPGVLSWYNHFGPVETPPSFSSGMAFSIPAPFSMAERTLRPGACVTVDPCIPLTQCPWREGSPERRFGLGVALMLRDMSRVAAEQAETVGEVHFNARDFGAAIGFALSALVIAKREAGALGPQDAART